MSAQWAKVRRWVLDRSGGRCEAGTEVCSGRAVHAHHVVPRSQGRDDTPGNLLAVCVECHDWIHSHPAAARERGWLRRRAVA